MNLRSKLCAGVMALAAFAVTGAGLGAEKSGDMERYSKSGKSKSAGATGSMNKMQSVNGKQPHKQAPGQQYIEEPSFSFGSTGGMSTGKGSGPGKAPSVGEIGSTSPALYKGPGVHSKSK